MIGVGSGANMSDSNAKIRLYVNASLGAGQPVSLNLGQSHYLFSVMRLGIGDSLRAFNGQNGEWLAQVSQAHKRAGQVICIEQSAPQTSPPDLWLLFAPLKKARTDIVVEKAVELGVLRIIPVLTQRTNAERLRIDRLHAHAIEAAEQCGATFVPPIDEPIKLDRILTTWPQDRTLIFCDETRDATTMAKALHSGQTPAAILIGPEGGFAPEESARIKSLPQTIAVTLGPRILRADTAALAALTIWQSALGDWK